MVSMPKLIFSRTTADDDYLMQLIANYCYVLGEGRCSKSGHLLYSFTWPVKRGETGLRDGPTLCDMDKST